jgi:hypothetical protein
MRTNELRSQIEIGKSMLKAAIKIEKPTLYESIFARRGGFTSLNATSCDSCDGAFPKCKRMVVY